MLDLNNQELLQSYVRDPYPMHAFIREQRLVKSPNNEWLVGRDEDVESILKDPRFAKQAPPGTEHRLPPYVDRSMPRKSMLIIDPPDHTRIRSRFVKAFSAKRIEAMRPNILILVDSLLDDVIPEGRMEAMSQYARPIPSTIIADMLGVPDRDRPRFNELSNELVKASFDIGRSITQEQRIRDTHALQGEFHSYLYGLFGEKRATPADDLISALLLRNEVEEALTDEELVLNILLLFVAGHETTVNLIGNALIGLSRHPQQLDKLRAHPELMPKAVEEFLRYDSSVQQLPRVAQEDVQIGEHLIRAGEMVILLLGSANRDERTHEAPDELDVERPFKRSKSFGGGVHYCLGAQLAKIETEIAVGRLLTRIPEFTIENLDSLVYPFNLFFRGPETLELKWCCASMAD